MEVKVHYLFSNNNKIGSKIISWGTKHLTDREDVPSHVAILVNNRWVHESTLESGVRVISYKKWLEINKEVAKVPCKQEKRNYSEIKTIFREIKDKDYDYLGVCYLGLALGANKLADIEIPKDNKWEDKNKYFCCEAVEKLTGVESTSMDSPVQVLDRLCKDGDIS